MRCRHVRDRVYINGRYACEECLEREVVEGFP